MFAQDLSFDPLALVREEESSIQSPSFSWCWNAVWNISSRWCTSGSHFWQQTQAWVQPVVDWATASTAEADFLHKLQQDESYQGYLVWHSRLKQQFRQLFKDIVAFYRQGKVVSPEQLRDALLAQQHLFIPGPVSPLQYEKSLKHLAQRLPRYAHVLEGVAAQLRTHLTAHPQEALLYFYHDTVNQFIDSYFDSRFTHAQGATHPIKRALQQVATYYQDLVPETLPQAVKELAVGMQIIPPAAVLMRQYQNLLQKLNTLFLQALAADQSDVAAFQPKGAHLLAGASDLLAKGWHFLKVHPLAALGTVAGTALGASTVYGLLQANSASSSITRWVDTFQPLTDLLSWTASFSPILFVTSYLNRGPAVQAWQAIIPLAFSLSTQPPFVEAQSAELWIKTLGEMGVNQGSFVQQTMDGGYIVTGSTNSSGAGSYDLWLSKWDATGDVSWVKTLGGTGDDEGEFVQQTMDGGYIVTGYTDSFGAGGYDLWLSKWDMTGNVSWVKTLGGTGDDEGYSVQQTTDGGYIVTGYTTSFGVGGCDLWLSKWDATGNVSWVKTLGGGGDDLGYAVQQTTDDGYIVTGGTDSFSAQNPLGIPLYDLWLSKWDATGNVSWVKILEATFDFYAEGYSVQQTTNDGYIVTGSIDSFGAGHFDLLLSKWDTAGSVSWVKTLGGAGDDGGDSVQQTTDGGYIVTGSTASFGAGGDDLWLSKWDTTGKVSWIKTLGGTGDDEGSSVQQTTDGGYIVTGSTASFGAGGDDLWLSKWDSLGNTVSSQCVSEPDLNSTSIAISALSIGNAALEGTPSVDAQNVTVLPQIVSPLVNTVCNESTSTTTIATTISTANTATTNTVFSPTSSSVASLTTTGITTSSTSMANTSTASTSSLTAGSSTVGTTTSSVTTGSTSSTIGLSTSMTASSRASSATTRSSNPDSFTTQTGSTTTEEGFQKLDTGVIAGAVVGGTIFSICIGFGAYGFFRHRKKRAQKAGGLEALVVELSSQPSSSSGDAEVMAMPAERVEKGHTKIGGRYELITRITKQEAEALEQQCGITVTFQEGKATAKFLLGQSQFGKLRLARHLETRAFVSVKKIKGIDEIAVSRNEATLQLALKGEPNILPLLDTMEMKDRNGHPVLYQFMQLAGFGNGDQLKIQLSFLTDTGLKQQCLLHTARSLLLGLSTMHRQHIFHLDMKPSNFVIDHLGDIFIIDFGCAQRSPDNNEFIYEHNGDTRYFPPERFMLLRTKYQSQGPGEINKIALPALNGVKADAWAVGVTLLELMSGYPFDLVNMATRVQQWDTAYFRQKLSQLSWLQDKQNPVAALLTSLLAVDPEARLSPEQALRLPIFQKSPFETREAQQEAFAYLKQLTPATRFKPSFFHPLPKAQDENYERAYRQRHFYDKEINRHY
jgi:serine/threonine protein kinase